MPSLDLLSATDVAKIGEMVTWGTKIKDIGWVVRKPQAENYARKLYAAMNKRPPNGAPGSATSKSLKLTDRMQYVALAAEYQDAVKRGTDRNDAMLAVYRQHFQWLRAQPPENRISSSIWMELSRKLDCRIARLVRCGCCGGQHVVEKETVRDMPKCMWCSHSMPVHQFVSSQQHHRHLKTG
ncbi:MAG: hypothetical protein ACRERX_13050 [Pseudomonas sp.]